MASIPQLSISSTDVPLLYEEKGHLSQTHHSPYNQNPSSQNKAPPPLSNTPEPTYPEGGLLAWSVVLGAFSGISASIGIYNSSGIFEAYVSTELLPDLSKTSIGWIFGIYTFVTWFLGVQIRPTALMVAERVCTLWGIFALSRCTEYYQALAFSILNATGSSLLVTPANASVAHWFNTCRGLASGAAFVGGSFGGVIFPLLLQSLIPKIACPWSLRVLGLILLLLCDTSVVLCRSRLPPRNGAATTWRDTLSSHRSSWDGTGAMAVTTVGIVLTDLAYFIPVTYVPGYYFARQDLGSGMALTGEAAFTY
ncbi:ProP Permease major facilitator superfamily [Pyrenophora tritici-repentis]|nr:ProP Permease major facilitator superfamily [Pyrenophora tritici-repentis]